VSHYGGQVATVGESRWQAAQAAQAAHELAAGPLFPVNTAGAAKLGRFSSSLALAHSVPATSRVANILLGAIAFDGAPLHRPSPATGGQCAECVPGARFGRGGERLFLLSPPFRASSHQIAPAWGKGRRRSHLSDVDPELECHSRREVTGSLLKQ